MTIRARGQGWRRRALLAGLVLGALFVLGRSFHLQVIQRERWTTRALDQQRQRLPLPAPRGTIYDRSGTPLAASEEVFRVAVAPRELRDRNAVARRLLQVLGLSASEARRAVDARRRWVVLPGRYDAAVRQRLDGERGIYFERVLERFYPHGRVALELLGRVSAEGRGVGGLELEFDSLLSGRPGVAVARRDGRGEAIPGSLLPVVEPVAGHDLYLTIDYNLQEIAHEALRQAVEQTGSVSGELILADPQTGEILAAASRRAVEGTHWRAAAEPYEPGSTLKPFLVAALLAEGRATLADSIYAEEGRYISKGRTITDTHGYGWLTLRDALRVSSNIAMAKAAGRLRPEEQYGYLRDFGFGSPTGIAYPSESAGVLRRPSDWSRYSQSSLAYGYEIGVTPLQMVLAYGTLANGGVLMEPRLIREVRARDGRTVRRFVPRPVRRVIPEAEARVISETLVDVVEAGTGQEARLGAFRVAGKTGTARYYHAGRYESGEYTASFAGFFPATDPQLTFLVKLDRPQGAYYGGLAAAPVTRSTLAAALAARSTVLDRRAVAASLAERSRMQQSGSEQGRSAGAAATTPGSTSGGRWFLPVSGPFIFALDGAPPGRYRAAGRPRRRPVPDVTGLALRDATRLLHAQGFRVVVEGSGPVAATAPAAGAMAVPGTVVRAEGRMVTP